MSRETELELGRARSVSEILRSALGLYGSYPLLFLILALAVMGPYDLAVLAATGRGSLGHGQLSAGTSWLLILLDFSLIGPLISALHIHAVVAIGEGRKPQLSSVALAGARVLPVVSAAEIVSNIGILLGFIALIIPGIVLTLRWAVVAQVAAVERNGWHPALVRSGDLTEKRYGHILGLLVITWVLTAGGCTPSESTTMSATCQTTDSRSRRTLLLYRTTTRHESRRRDDIDGFD